MKIINVLLNIVQGISPFVIAMFFVVSLVAPFTFLKPNVITIVDIEEVKEKKKEVVEQPLHSVYLPDFSAIQDVNAKKQQFFDFLLPAVIEHNNKLLALRSFIQAIKLKLSLNEKVNIEEHDKITRLITTYLPKGSAVKLDQDTLNTLLINIDIVPTPLVLIQAANESAWGTSRFARIGLNFFGIWCFRQGCGMVPGGRNNGAKHEVAAFQSVEAAVERYLFNINTHRAYRVFRTIRGQLRTLNQPLYANTLATGLLSYSERGSDYVSDINDMLKHNRRYFQEFEPVITPTIVPNIAPKVTPSFTPALYVDVTADEEIIPITNNQ